MPTRRAQIANNIRPQQRSGTGGTSAPRAAARSGSMGLGQAQGARNPVGPGRPAGGGALGQARPAGGAPGVAPGAPAAGGGMPWDVAAANSEAAAGKRLQNSLTGLDSGWLRTQQDYGLEGQWGDYASNPYSRASLLQRSYDNTRRGSTNAAGHNLYAGSYVNAQNQNTHGFNLGRDELQKAYAEQNASYVSARQQAQDEYNEAIAQAAWERVNAGLASEPEPAPAPGAPAGPSKAPKSRKATIRQNIGPARKAK